MSFMFNPHPYNEMTAVNEPNVSDYIRSNIKKGNNEIVDELVKNVKNKVLVLDGYI